MSDSDNTQEPSDTPQEEQEAEQEEQEPVPTSAKAKRKPRQPKEPKQPKESKRNSKVITVDVGHTEYFDVPKNTNSTIGRSTWCWANTTWGYRAPASTSPREATI